MEKNHNNVHLKESLSPHHFAGCCHRVRCSNGDPTGVCKALYEQIYSFGDRLAFKT